MKKLIPLMLASTLLSITTLASAQTEIVGDDACFVVSGTKHDHNGALNRLASYERQRLKYPFAGYSCTVFNSYSELKSYLSHSGPAKNSAIFVMQVAHGGITGTGLLNGGLVQSQQIIKEIRDLSLSYKVAFLNQSCFGGSIIQDKIKWDEANIASKSIDRSCVWADAVPGRVTFNLDSIPRSNVPYDLEEAYSARPDGITSSAAWSEVKMAEYYHAISQLPGYRLKEKSVIHELYPLASHFVTGMANVMYQSADDVSPSSKTIMNSARFILDPETSDARARSVLGLGKKSEINFEPTRLAVFNPPVSTDVCTLAVRKFITAQWYPIFRSSSQVWGLFLNKLRNDVKNDMEINGSCADSGQNNVTAQDWVKWLTPHSPIAAQLAPYAIAHDQFEKNFGENTNLSTAMESYIGIEPRVPTVLEMGDKVDVLMSIIGRVILAEETFATIMPGGLRSFLGYPNLGVEGATGNVFPAFNLASIKLPELKNSLDERRRNACRSIQLKPW